MADSAATYPTNIILKSLPPKFHQPRFKPSTRFLESYALKTGARSQLNASGDPETKRFEHACPPKLSSARADALGRAMAVGSRLRRLFYLADSNEGA